jgi:hypothetical protein
MPLTVGTPKTEMTTTTLRNSQSRDASNGLNICKSRDASNSRNVRTIGMSAGQRQKQKLQGCQQTVWSLPTAGITKTVPPTTEGVPATVDVTPAVTPVTARTQRFMKNLTKN